MFNEPMPKDDRSLASIEESNYTIEGVDLTLIRWMLSLTPAERLRALQHSAQSILRLRHGNPDA